MVKIRLSRIGKKKKPFYKIVVSDSRNPADGRFIEQIGTYDPHTDPGTVRIKEDRAVLWLNRGAQPTETVSKLFRQAGVSKSGVKKPAKAEAVKEEAQAEAVAEETAEAEVSEAEAAAEETAE